MAMSTLESGPKLDWTRDNQMFECYRIWKRKVEFIFCSALADATPKQLVSYLKYWMGDQGIPLIEKWESTGKLDYSNADETPATEGGRRRVLSSGYKVQTYWDLLDEEFKPKGNKLLSIIELWTRSKQGDKPLNQWLTQVYNLVNVCKYPEDSTDRIIRDVLIIGCNSNSARDKIIRQGEAVSLNQVIEILQTEESTHSTMQQIQDFQKKPIQQISYTTYNARSKKSKKPSNKQNSSSTGSKRQCFRCGEPYSRKHLEECKAKNVTCNGCGIKDHFQKCCKKSGNFPKDNSNRQNQSSSTGPSRMNYAAGIPIEADFFDEKGLPKVYRPPPIQPQIGSMNILRSISKNDAILISENSEEILPVEQPKQSRNVPNTSTSVSDTMSDPVPPPEFPFTEFPSTEVVTQSQIDISSISDMLDPRETSNSSRKATRSTDSPLKSMQNRASDEEMGEIRDLTVSEKHLQSTRDSSTISISENSTTSNSTPGTYNGISFEKEEEIQRIHPETELSNNRSVMPTDVQALTVLQDLLSDDFQAKNTHSLQRKREDTHSTQRNEAFQLIQKIHNQLQLVQWDLQRLQSMHKYEF